MATNPTTTLSWSQVQKLQRSMEDPLLQLERAGCLSEAAADEIRTIVAEGIAEKFGERYRVFPDGPRPEKLQIRRSVAPQVCVLRKKFDEQARPNAKQNSNVVNAARTQARPLVAGAATASAAKATIKKDSTAPIYAESKVATAKPVYCGPTKRVASAKQAARAKKISSKKPTTPTEASPVKTAPPKQRDLCDHNGLTTSMDKQCDAFYNNPPEVLSKISSSSSSSPSAQKKDVFAINQESGSLSKPAVPKETAVAINFEEDDLIYLGD